LLANVRKSLTVNQPLNAPSYVRRQADLDLYEALLRSEFCYILNSRQMGQSSLWVQTMNRLQSEGVCCGVIDLTAIGTQEVTPEHWYASVGDDRTIILWDVQRILKLDELAYACDRVRNYLRTNAQVKEEDRHLCDRITNNTPKQ